MWLFPSLLVQGSLKAAQLPSLVCSKAAQLYKSPPQRDSHYHFFSPACMFMFVCLCPHLQTQDVHLLQSQDCGLALVVLILQTLSVFKKYLLSFQAVIFTLVTEHLTKLIYCPCNLSLSQRATLVIILGVSDTQKYSGG